MERKKKPRPRPARKPARAKKVTRPRKGPVRATIALPPSTAPVPVPPPEVAAEEPALVLAVPELAFAERAPSPAPDPPPPANRRAIFYDVENASQPGHIAQVIEHLAIDRLGRRTDFIAVGNWRVIGADTARLLARHGAQLVHSAPSTGVRDWSDLRIAVSAGAWLAAARPGDMLEIVTDDRAFDAVGDVAAGLGIAFRRLSHRSLTDQPSAPPREAPEPGARRERRGRYRRYGRRPPATAAVEQRRAEPRQAEPPLAEPHQAEPRQAEPAATSAASAHTAPHDEIIHIVRELVERSPSGAVLIDSVARTLKARGFARPPGSPRLVTRLRRIKEIGVSPAGMITLVGEPAPPEPVAPTVVELVPAPDASSGQRRRRSRRGGRGRRRPAVVPVPG
jgi:hypothetical protein